MPASAAADDGESGSNCWLHDFRKLALGNFGSANPFGVTVIPAKAGIQWAIMLNRSVGMTARAGVIEQREV